MAHALTHKNLGHRTDDEGTSRQDDTNQQDVHEHAVVDKDLQHAEYGGFHLGPTFFGWLVATGMAAMLTALLAAFGSAVALTTGATAIIVTGDPVSTVGIASSILLLIALGLAYYSGGYVAGRMARFDGGRQGLGVWLIGIILAVLLGVIGAIAGSQFNILSSLNLPSLPINEGTLTTAGLITLIAATAVALLAAIAGGKKGAQYHDAIDETGRIGTTSA
jgi:hypothetical protein